MFGLRNGDRVENGGFVFANVKDDSRPKVGKVLEILQICGSDSELRREPDVVLLSLYSVGESVSPYCMPGLSETEEYSLVEFNVSLCFLLGSLQNY